MGRAWTVCGQCVGSRKGGKMIKKELKGQKGGVGGGGV